MKIENTIIEIYYTPQIKEFYHGFEYELKTDEDTWQKKTFGESKRDDFNNILKGLNYENIRVKCLDEVDIVSLGWVKKKQIVTGIKMVEFTHIGSSDVHTFDMIWYSDNRPTFIRSIIEPSNSSVQTNIFKGTIKNKSELIKVMEMLNIEL